MATADELARSLRGATALLNCRADALREFEISFDAFWRSFAAIGLTLPAYVVDLALLRHRLAVHGPLFGEPGLAAIAALGHLAGFLAFPLAMIVVARRFGLGDRYAALIIVTNWLAVFTSYALAVPGTLMLLGFETPAVAALVAGAFSVVALVVHWRAARAILGIGAIFAALVTALAFALTFGTDALVGALA